MNLGKLVERLLQLVPVLLGVSTIVFLMMALTPGDPVEIIIGDQPITEAQIRELQASGAQIGLRIRVCTLIEAFAQPWQNLDVKRQWVDAFNYAAQAQANRLRNLAHQLDAARAKVNEQALGERLNHAAQYTPSPKKERV